MGRHSRSIRPAPPLRGLVIARIVIARRDGLSPDDRADLGRCHARDRDTGPARFLVSRGRGETLDRVDRAEAEAAVESGACDLVVVADLGRICCRNRAVDFFKANPR